MVQKKYRDLNSEQQRIFIGEFERRKKSLGVAYLLWILGGWYYAYLKKLGWLILFLLTAGGLFIWAIIDLFRIPKLIEDYNNDLALEILRDISIMFPAQENQNLDQIVSKKSVNDHYIAQKTQSGESYSFFIIVGLLILFSISAFYFKPDRNQMQNKIVDDVMLHQPQLIKIMKNFFIGEELNEKYSETFITFFLSQNGYKNVGIYEEDLVLVRKLTFKDENSKENLLTAYGFLGLTKISYDNNGLQEKNIFDHRKKNNSVDIRNTNYDVIEPEKYNGDSEIDEREFDRDNSIKNYQNSSETSNLSDNQEDSIKI